MELSARNQLAGRVRSITLGEVMAEVVIEVGEGLTIVAAVTRGSVEQLGLAEGDPAVAVIKATEVMVGKPSGG